MIKHIIFVLITSISFFSVAQDRNEKYINKWKDVAIDEMVAFKIPASITLAQGILESGAGTSYLATKANNHFGVKCHNWKGPSVKRDDDKKNECFRKYKSANTSFEDHSKFIAERGRYSFLFDYKIKDYKAWAKGLKKAGYATNPKYPGLLIDLIERYNLDQYDDDGVNIIKGKKKKTTLKKEELLVSNSKNKEQQNISEEVENIPLKTVEVYLGRYKVLQNPNKSQYIVATSDDTYYAIAKKFKLDLWQLYMFNDIDEHHILKIDDKVYVMPKKARARRESHIVKKGESLWQVAQIYGVKEKKVRRFNKLKKGAKIKPGTVLILR